MEARKFIDKNLIKEDGKEFLLIKHEYRNIDLPKRDWDWIYENIMSDDYDCAQSNGFYESESGYYSIDCQMVGERFDEWLEDLKDDEESLEDYNDEFQKDFHRIKAIMYENIDFTIYYEE